jgi:hypothetical protein
VRDFASWPRSGESRSSSATRATGCRSASACERSISTTRRETASATAWSSRATGHGCSSMPARPTRRRRPPT